ncbi:hypothetical protein TWF191_001436 [Orbilia oligospora]|uniref:Endo-1,5-alpha-L-arabinanase A n=1 Tax=Orbilia oligospora TaxID=2813651 RepID=A0A7C8UA46_ORBOL|nr:hypothetical protein TWF191_001436 [Orbilia oligospora]
MLLKLAVTFLVSFAELASAAYANPGACSGDCGTHDPAVIRRTSDGKFYRFSTNNFISIASASSIAGPWTYLGQALPGGSKISGFSGVDLWAPDIIYNNGVYYLYYSVSSFGSQNSAIGVATSSTMDPGSWVDRGATGVSSKTGSAYNAIDSNIVKVGNDFYMAFGSFWGDIYQVKMDSGLLKTAGTSSYQIAWTSFGNGAMEGGFKDKNGVDCKSSGGTTILESHDYVYAPGHGGVIDVPGVGSVLYYHYVNNNQGTNQAATYFGWNVLDWPSDWPVISTGTSTPTTTTKTTTSRAAQTTTTAAASGNCASLYGQCGGQGFTGASCCSSGTCKYSNDWYSQCL